MFSHASRAEFEALRSEVHTLSWRLDNMAEDIEGLKTAEAAEEASTADLRAKLEQAVADLNALKATAPADNTAAIQAIIDGLTADTAKNAAEPGETTGDAGATTTTGDPAPADQPAA